MVLYHIYTISKQQGKRETVAIVGTEEEAEALCDKNVLYAYETVDNIKL